jgi:quercetin dioxygenase-like cupin family protein
MIVRTLITAFLALAATPALAQPKPDAYQAFRPDPGHVRFILRDDIPWTGAAGVSQQYLISGDPAKPGPYVMLLKWWPNHFSRPHFHDQMRYFTVVSGTWWMSSSATYDPASTYPMPPGTVVVHQANEVHWDGAKDEPAVIMLSGMGPVKTTSVDEHGKPLPVQPKDHP